MKLAELKARFDAGRVREAVNSAPALVREARAVGYEPLIAETLALQGTISYKADDSANAEKALLESFSSAEASRHDEVRAEDAVNLVFVVGFQEGRFIEGRQWASIAESILRRLGGHDLLHGCLLNDLGTVYFTEGQKDAAVRAMRESLAFKRKALGPEHPDVGVSEGNLAISLAGLGRNEEALEHIRRSVALLERGLGVAHPDLAIQLSNHGEILNALGRYSDARQLFERARVIQERELGPDNRSLGYALTGIGVSYLADGDAPSALPILERAFKIREAQETDPSKKAETEFALARALWAAGHDRPRARSVAEQARADYARTDVKTRMTEIESWLRSHGSS